MLGQYLNFLARDIAASNVRVLTPELAGRVKSLVEGVEVDLDAPLSADDE